MNNNDETGIVTFEEKREVCYVIYFAHHIDLLNRLHIDPDHFAKLANLKLEMCPPCLLHLESDCLALPRDYTQGLHIYSLLIFSAEVMFH